MTDSNKKFFTRTRINQLEKLSVQIVFLILFPEVFSTALSGAKYIASGLGRGEYIEINSFVLTLVLMSVLTIIFGRFFCTNLCAFGTSQDILQLVSQPVFGKKRPRLPQLLVKLLNSVKYIILLVILILCFTGLITKAAGMSPWDVFSMITAGKLHSGGYTAGIIILIVIAVFSFIEPRFFCRFMCPMGALYSLLPNASIKKPRKFSQFAWLILRAAIYGILFYLLSKVVSALL